MTQRSSLYVSWTSRPLPDGGGDDTIVTAVPSSTEKVSGPRTQFGSVRPLEHLQPLASIHSAKSRFAHTCAHGFQVKNDHFEPGEKQAHFNRPEAAGRKMLSGQTLARRSRWCHRRLHPPTHAASAAAAVFETLRAKGRPFRRMIK